MFANLLSLEFRRQRLLRKVPPGPLHDFLSVPFPSAKQNCRDVEYVALDLETTGLDAQIDEILSFGFVQMTGRRIDLTTAQHWLASPTRAIPERSAIIHQITDDAAAAGEPLERLMARLLPRLAGRVLIAHHARVEFQFLNAACERLYGGRFLMPIVDTQWIEQRTLDRRNRSYAPKELRLGRLRERYNLPRYRAHDALSDALAAGELFLAQLAEREGGHNLPLRDFLVKL